MESEKFEELKKKLWRYMEEHIYPNEQAFLHECEVMAKLPGTEWRYPKVVISLQKIAKELGLWNLWLPNDTAAIAGKGYEGAGLTNLQYAELCEIMGTSNHMEFAALTTNCASPDTGNMETIARFGSEDQKAKWLKPLLEGHIRSCFAMTEPDVSGSDATNISIKVEKRGSNYVINGRKWWITGAGAEECKIMILMGKTDPKASPFRQQSMILVPMETPGITVLRPMQTLGDPEAPKGHMDILFENVVVPQKNVLGEEGAGFQIAQARLGPGRIHHCMRLLGTAERALSLMCRRAQTREAFGKKFVEFDTVLHDIAKSRADIDMGRMLVRHTANLLDVHGSKLARKELSMCKAVIPKMVQEVCDRAMQVHGAMGISQDTPLAVGFTWARWLRFADGADSVHWQTSGRLEMRDQMKSSVLYKIPYYAHPDSQVHRKNPSSKL